MAEIYKQSFKQDYSDHVEMAIFNCGLEHCAPLHSWGPAVRDHYLIHPNTAALLEKLLLMLREEGEEKTFAYIRREVLKNQK